MNELIFSELERIERFPVCRTRKNVSSKKITAFCLGDVPYRGQRILNFQTRGPSKFNRKYTKLLEMLKSFVLEIDPSFQFTTIQVNKNIQCEPHVDKNNMGPSYIIGLGNYDGGDLVIEGKEISIKNKWVQFDGRKAHWTNPFNGTRYSIIYFTHTFKPPLYSLINLQVSRENVKDKNGKVISSW